MKNNYTCSTRERVLLLNQEQACSQCGCNYELVKCQDCEKEFKLMPESCNDCDDYVNSATCGTCCDRTSVSICNYC